MNTAKTPRTASGAKSDATTSRDLRDPRQGQRPVCARGSSHLLDPSALHPRRMPRLRCLPRGSLRPRRIPAPALIWLGVSIWAGSVVLVTGGTGTFGTAFTELLLKTEKPASVRILARSEHRLADFQRRFSDERIRLAKGDVRDLGRMLEVADGAHIIVHAAALKRVEGTQDAEEMIKTNIVGSMNVVHAALERGVERVMGISSDKACQAITLYGATKLAMEQLFLSAHGRKRTAFGICRYGNVAGSTGSIIPFFRDRWKRGLSLPITDKRSTRFWISIEDAVRWVKRRIELMEPGRVYVPIIPSVKVVDIATAISKENETGFSGEFRGESVTIGMRGLEKLHEQMVGFDESRSARWGQDDSGIPHYVLGGEPTGREEFVYASDQNDQWLTVDEIVARLPKIA